MIKFIEDSFVLKDKPSHVILPITVKPGLQPHGTEEFCTYFPSLRYQISDVQKGSLVVGDYLNEMTEISGVKISLLVTDFRSGPGANIHYLTQSLASLSTRVGCLTEATSVAPFANDSEIPASVIKKLVAGIITASPVELGFYLK